MNSPLTVNKLCFSYSPIMKSLIVPLAAFLASPALADSPSPPPEKLTVCSPARKLCAISDPGKNVTLVSSQVNGQAPWTIPGWHRWLFPSDDGESVVVGHDGMNLVPVDVTLSEPVLFFYNQGRLVRTIKLGQLYGHKQQLQRTASHFAWVRNIGFKSPNQFVVELVNGKEVAFAPETGVSEQVGADPNPSNNIPINRNVGIHF